MLPGLKKNHGQMKKKVGELEELRQEVTMEGS